MTVRIGLCSDLELVIISGGSLRYNKNDKQYRDLVRRTYKEVQVEVLKERGENVDDKALLPKDSIGPTRYRGTLTDRDDPQPGYNHLILNKVGEKGEAQPIGLRVTDEFRIPHFGRILMEYYPAMVPARHSSQKRTIDLQLLSEEAKGTASLTPQEVLLIYDRHLTKAPNQYVLTISDGVGIDTRVLAGKGYERFGPIGKEMVWVPPLNAGTKEEYQRAIPADIYVKFGPNFSGHRIPEDAALFIAVEKYIRDGGAELSAKELKRIGYDFDTLPSVVKTIRAIRAVAKSNGGYIPCSPISLAQK